MYSVNRVINQVVVAAVVFLVWVKSRAKMFMPSTIKEKFSSVAGAAEAKEELEDMVDF